MRCTAPAVHSGARAPRQGDRHEFTDHVRAEEGDEDSAGVVVRERFDAGSLTPTAPLRWRGVRAASDYESSSRKRPTLAPRVRATRRVGVWGPQKCFGRQDKSPEGASDRRDSSEPTTGHHANAAALGRERRAAAAIRLLDWGVRDDLRPHSGPGQTSRMFGPTGRSPSHIHWAAATGPPRL